MAEFSNPVRTDGVETILTVSRAGKIQSVQQGSPLEGEAPKTLDQFWQPTVCQQLRVAIKRALSTREAQWLQPTDDDCAKHQFVLIPQGRDRVQILAMDCESASKESARIRRLAFVDEMTGLPNRFQVVDLLERVLPVRHREEGRAAILQLYIDSPDGSLELLPSQIVDEVIRGVADRFERELRGGAVGALETGERVSVVARTDFRQFSIILPNIESGNDAESVAARMVSLLGEPIEAGAEVVSLQVSTGIGLFPQDGSDASTLMANAQMAMEDARQTGTQSFRMHSGTVRLRALQRQDLSSELRSALAREDFQIRYLPILGMHDQAPLTFFAELHWPDAIRQARTPAELLSIATRTGVMPAVNDWMFEKCASDIKRVRRRGHESVSFFIQLTHNEFFRQGMSDALKAVISQHKLDPKNLCIGVEERTLDRDLIGGGAVCERLSDIGVSLAITAFGRRRFALSTLSSGYVDTVFLDEAIVRNAKVGNSAHLSLQGAVSLLSTMNQSVFVPGVDTPEVQALIAAMGVDAIAGKMVGQALPLTDVQSHLDATATETSRSAAAT